MRTVKFASTKNVTVHILIIFFIVVLSLSMTSCQKKGADEIFNSNQELYETLVENCPGFLYPEFAKNSTNASKQKYVAIQNDNGVDWAGYKIYNFASPFYICVTAYNCTSDKLLSDSSDRMQLLKQVESENGEITVYTGEGHKNTLFFIGAINIGSNHYEVRVVADDEMVNNEYVHAIYTDNQYYQMALDLIPSIVDSLADINKTQ